MKTVLLFSGGLDSLACLDLLRARGHEVRCLFVNFGQQSLEQERKAVSQLSEKLNFHASEAKIDFGKRFGAGEITGRNTALIACGIMAANEGTSFVAIGIHAGSPYYDCSPLFAKRMTCIVTECSGGRLEFSAPLLKWRKRSIIDHIKERELPFELTYSCESGEYPPCGSCLSCKDRELLEC
ncbi:MAG: 7-cyano-7-deazaguanine synthase [Rhodospirillales bacterium]